MLATMTMIGNISVTTFRSQHEQQPCRHPQFHRITTTFIVITLQKRPVLQDLDQDVLVSRWALRLVKPDQSLSTANNRNTSLHDRFSSW